MIGPAVPFPLAKTAPGSYPSRMFCNTDLCKQCDSCIAECPFEVVVSGKDGFPKLRPPPRNSASAAATAWPSAPWAR